MWRPWGNKKSPLLIKDSPSPSPSRFPRSSFKDIQRLCSEDSSSSLSSVARRTATVFHRVRIANTLLRAWSSARNEARPDPNGKVPDSVISIPGGEKRIVVYFTSLRVVRSTFEDCKTVRSILRGFRVSIDERDVSMDSRFLNELQGILGQKKLTLPRVFIGGRYMGGADEIKQLHETGELKKLVEGLPAAEPATCDACGGFRFVLCHECDGSRKLFTEKSGFKTCTACNENGLIRCPSCSCAPL